MSTRHHSPSATAPGTSAQSWNSGARSFLDTLPEVATVQAKTATLSATSVGHDERASARLGARDGHAAARTASASPTQSTHW